MRGMMIAGGLALALGSLAAGQPIEKTGPCPELARTNFYNGFDVRSFNNLSSASASIATPNWGGGRPPQALLNAGLIQAPLTPQQSINCVLTPPGLKPQIVASELTPGPAGAKPMAYPLSFNFDERGRLWVVDTRDYPYTHDSTGMPPSNSSSGIPSNRLTGQGRILILEDTNGDGALDNFKIFYQGFVVPNSMEFVKNGIIVMVPPNVYYIPKSTTNPDTAGGAPVVVVQSMGSSGNDYDTHSQPNSITRNIDNWFYGHTGWNGCGGSNVNVANATGGSSRSGTCGNGNIYRFKHATLGSDTSRFEVHSSGQFNAHGVGFMEDGQLFVSGATGTTHNQHVVRAGVAALDIRFASGGSGTTDRSRLYSLTNDRYMWEGNNNVISANPNSGNVTYYSTGISAVSGSDFYTARLLPQKYWGRFQFACEGMSGLCNQDSLVVNGSSWLSHRLYPGNRWPNIFASTDAWSAPMLARTGPDGALWVLDFYYYLFLHNPATPATNHAYRHPLRYKMHSRFYRIVPEDGQVEPLLNLTNATTRQLVIALYHTNMVWRMHAQRLLIEQGYNTELGDLLDSVLTKRRQVDAIGLDAPVVHALWTLHGLKQFEANPTRWNPILKQLLLHPSWAVRRNVLQVLPATTASYEAIRDQCSVNDTHPHVRLQAFENLARIPATGAVIQSLDGMRTEPSGPTGGSQTYLTASYNAAGTSKVVSGGAGTERPSGCPAYLAPADWTVSIKGGNAVPFRFSQDVRFDVRQGGFVLASNARLPSGELVVHDLRGKVVFRSTWNREMSSWSNLEARDLAHPVYFYTYRAYSGERFNGRIPLSAI